MWPIQNFFSNPILPTQTVSLQDFTFLRNRTTVSTVTQSSSLFPSLSLTLTFSSSLNKSCQLYPQIYIHNLFTFLYHLNLSCHHLAWSFQSPPSRASIILKFLIFPTPVDHFLHSSQSDTFKI